MTYNAAVHHQCCIKSSMQHYIINPTDTPRQIDTDSMAILCQYIKQKISTNFHVISTYFLNIILMDQKLTSFWRNFDEWKIDVALMYFLRRNIDGQKIDIVSKCFVWSNFDEQKSTSFQRTLFDVILMSKKSMSF